MSTQPDSTEREELTERLGTLIQTLPDFATVLASDNQALRSSAASLLATRLGEFAPGTLAEHAEPFSELPSTKLAYNIRTFCGSLARILFVQRPAMPPETRAAIETTYASIVPFRYNSGHGFFEFYFFCVMPVDTCAHGDLHRMVRGLLPVLDPARTVAETRLLKVLESHLGQHFPSYEMTPGPMLSRSLGKVYDRNQRRVRVDVDGYRRSFRASLRDLEQRLQAQYAEKDAAALAQQKEHARGLQTAAAGRLGLRPRAPRARALA